MDERKASKLRDIMGATSDAAEIMRQIGNPRVLESLDKVKDTAKIINEIIHGLNTSEMVKNIENFRLISENMNEASVKIENTVNQLRETGVISETSELIKSARGTINSFTESGLNSMNSKDIRDISVASKEMLLSIKDLVNEITVSVASSKKSVTIQNIKETIKDASDIYKMTQA